MRRHRPGQDHRPLPLTNLHPYCHLRKNWLEARLDINMIERSIGNIWVLQTEHYVHGSNRESRGEDLCEEHLIW